MVVIRSSVSLSVCLCVCNKHVNISRTNERNFMKFCTHIFQQKSMSQNFFGHPRMTLGWINPEFDFFPIPLSPLKLRNFFLIFFAPSVLSYAGSVFSQKNWSFNVLGCSGWQNLKIQGLIYPSMLLSKDPVIGIWKNFFSGKNVVKENTLSQKNCYPHPRVP